MEEEKNSLGFVCVCVSDDQMNDYEFETKRSETKTKAKSKSEQIFGLLSSQTFTDIRWFAPITTPTTHTLSALCVLCVVRSTLMSIQLACFCQNSLAPKVETTQDHAIDFIAPTQTHELRPITNN